MFTPRRVLLLASLAVPLAMTACKKTNNDETQPPLTSVPAAAADPAPTVATEPRAAAERIVVSGSIEGLDDVFAGFKKFSESYMPDEATDPQAEIQAMLLGMGFGPGFWGNIDLGGVHSFTSATPLSGGGPDDSSLAASIAVVDARKLIENMPQSQRPSPLGEGMWELAIDETRLLMREQGKELLLGFSTDDIGTAGSLRGKATAGARIRMRATNIPTDDIDPAAVLEELPLDSKFVQDLSKIVQELDAITFETDLGTTRDFQMRLGAVAPFHKLGLDPIGAPRTAPTALEARLPPNPVFVTTLSWGDPTLLHAIIDGLPIGDLGDPIQGMVDKAVKSSHTLLDQVASDVAFALYVDSKGRATIVIAADVKDDAKAKAALQGVHEVLAEGAATQATMAGKNKDAAIVAKLELDGLKVAGGKADRLTIKVPKDFLGDVQKGKMFLRKGSLDAVSHVDQGTAILAIGAGASTIIRDVAKSLGKTRKNSLAQHSGLAGLRTSMGGCQICVAGDPLSYFRFRLMLVRDEGEDKAIVKKASEQMYTLSKLGSIGQPAMGVKVEADQASFGVMIPQQTLFAAPATIEKLGEINEFVGDPESAASEDTAQSR